MANPRRNPLGLKYDADDDDPWGDDFEPSSSSSLSSSIAGGSTVLGLMAFATTFSLAGNELKMIEGAKSPSSADAAFGGPITEGGRIIIGGTFATAILLMISHAGDAGRTFAVGVAAIAALSSALVYGAPVWNALNTLFKSTPTKPLTGGTTPTTALASSSSGSSTTKGTITK